MVDRDFDLHIHSDKSSDGSCFVETVFNFAKKLGVKLISITDHNSIDNLEDCIKYSKETGVSFIPGVEVTCYYNSTYIVHILAYFKPNMSFDFLSEMIEPFLSKARLGEVIDCTKFISFMKYSGGITSLAHPFIMTDKNNNIKEVSYTFANQIIFELHRAGLTGLEVFRGKHLINSSGEDDIAKTHFLYNLAEKYNLIKTAGSDFHHPGKDHIGIWNSYGLDCELPEFFSKIL